VCGLQRRLVLAARMFDLASAPEPYACNDKCSNLQRGVGAMNSKVRWVVLSGLLIGALCISGLALAAEDKKTPKKDPAVAKEAKQTNAASVNGVGITKLKFRRKPIALPGRLVLLVNKSVPSR